MVESRTVHRDGHHRSGGDIRGDHQAGPPSVAAASRKPGRFRSTARNLPSFRADHRAVAPVATRTGVLRIGCGQPDHLRPPYRPTPQPDRFDPDLSRLGLMPRSVAALRAAASLEKVPTWTDQFAACMCDGRAASDACAVEINIKREATCIALGAIGTSICSNP